jgi:hypothetical protein
MTFVTEALIAKANGLGYMARIANKPRELDHGLNRIPAFVNAWHSGWDLCDNDFKLQDILKKSG